MKKFTIILSCVLILIALAACGSGNSSKDVSIDIEKLYDTIMSETATESMSVLSEKKMSTYIGLSSDSYRSAIVSLCGDSVLADEIWLVEAVDADALEEITALAKERLSQKALEMENYLPDQYEIVKQAKVVQRGNYLGVFVSPEAETMAKLFNEA